MISSQFEGTSWLSNKDDKRILLKAATVRHLHRQNCGQWDAAGLLGGQKKEVSMRDSCGYQVAVKDHVFKLVRDNLR